MMSKALCICPSLRIPRLDDGRVVLTRKFVEGVQEYQLHWPGPITVVSQPAAERYDHLDSQEYALKDLPFHLELCDFEDSAALADKLRNAGLVQATLDYEMLELPRICNQHGIPLVYVSELTLRTRLQILAAEPTGFLVRMRRSWWTLQMERQYRRAVRQATGIHCNGTPTFQAYRGLSAHPLLFFDTRVRRRQLIDPQTLGRRSAELCAGRPLRLAFSGRLIAIKGADHLPRLARDLVQRGVDFTLDIIGGGELAKPMAEQIRRWGLADRVRLRGVMDFATELLPFVSEQVDLFVCCHRQGDPSCTYLETMACGVPVVGYANEALAGLVGHSGVGWTTPMDDPSALAGRIAELNRNRPALAEAARAAVAFASQHTFESTFEQRTQHMLALCEMPVASVKPVSPLPATPQSDRTLSAEASVGGLPTDKR